MPCQVPLASASAEPEPEPEPVGAAVRLVEGEELALVVSSVASVVTGAVVVVGSDPTVVASVVLGETVAVTEERSLSSAAEAVATSVTSTKNAMRERSMSTPVLLELKARKPRTVSG